MGIPLTVKIYPNPANANRSPETLIDDWTADVQNLRFGTAAFGGYSNCTFTLRRGFDRLYRHLEGAKGQRTYITNRLRIEETGKQTRQVVPWEGLIATMELQYGQQFKSRSYLNMYNAVRLQHLKLAGTRKTYTLVADTAQSAKFGIRVFVLDTKLRANANTALPTAIATRFLQTHKYPNRAGGTEIGGVQRDVGLQVTCIGMADTLKWRWAFNTKSTTALDTGEILKEMLRATTLYKWHEPGVGNYGQQFIVENFNSIAATGITVPSVELQGRPRLDIIADLLEYGNSSGERMLFQVFQGTGGKGRARFARQPNALPFTDNYNGYYFNGTQNQIFDRSQKRIMPWLVRAGNWLTDVDSKLSPPNPASDIFLDSRCMWLEETMYDVDSDILRLKTPDQANAEGYLGRLIQGAALVTETI